MKFSILIVCFLFTLSSYAQSVFKSDELFLLQNINNHNKIILIPDNQPKGLKFNFLYIPKECPDCLIKLNNLSSSMMSNANHFIICESILYVTLKEMVDTQVRSNSIKNIIYHDPGGRIKSFFKINDKNPRLISIEGLNIKLNRDTQIDVNKLRGFF